MNYLTDPIGKLYQKMVPSAIGSMLTATVASLIDTVILSYFLGPEMLSSVSICMPIYMILNALALLISSGGATLSAAYIGKGDTAESNRCFTVSFACMAALGLLLTVVGLLFTGPIIGLLGANAVIWDATLAYAKVLMAFMLPLMFYSLMLFYVRFDSDPGLSLAATGVCAVTNLILDVLFVGPMQMGPGGAALATCLAYTLATLVGFTHFMKKKNTLRLLRGSLRLRRLGDIVRTGAPLSVSQFGMAFTTSVFNTQIMRIGGELYVTVYAVITQLSMSAMALYEGVAQAAQPIFAANFGAKQPRRVAQAMRTGLLLEIIFTGACLALFIIGAKTIAGFFSIYEGELLRISIHGIRLFALSIPFTGLNMLATYFFQTRERQTQATLISLLNGTVLLIAALLVLTAFGSADNIWWSWLMAQGLCLIYTVFAVYRDVRKVVTQLRAARSNT